MISLIKMSDSGPLGSLVGFKWVARLEASGSDKQPLPNHAILSKSSHDHRHNINHKKLKRLKNNARSQWAPVFFNSLPVGKFNQFLLFPT